jgi:hypothetical protein
MKVLVCGSRHFNDIELLDKVLNEVHDSGGHPYENEITDLIHGCAKGADMLAHFWAGRTYRHDGRYIRIWQYPANWKEYGKAAGPIRNKQMLDEGKPDLVVAFLAPNSRGTQNMIDQATKAGIPVRIINIGGNV